MNYKKVELIFLIAFLMLNGYLLSICKENSSVQNMETVSEKVNIETIMKKGHITYTGPLSSKHAEGTYLSADTTNLFNNESTLKNQTITNNQGVLTSRLDQSLWMTGDSDELQAQVEQFLKQSDHIQYGKDYRYLKNASYNSDKAICYAQQWHDVPIFDETAEIVFIKESVGHHKSRIIGYKQQHITNMKAMRDNRELISQKEALHTLYSNGKLPSNSTINWMVLGYTKILTTDQTNVYVPTWLISVKTEAGTDQVTKVNAIMNRIMNNNDSD